MRTHRWLRTGAPLVMLAFTVGCGGSPSAPSASTAPSAAPAPPAAATSNGTFVDAPPLTVGTLPNTNPGNTLPFGGQSSAFPNTTYQQVYSAAQFGSAQLRILAIQFFAVPLPSRPTASVAPATYTFSLSTTAARVDGLNTTNLSANVGPDNRTLLSSTLTNAIANDILTVTFDTPFVYSPSNGNLLLQILRTNATPGSGNSFVNHSPNDGYPAGLSSRAHDFGSGFAGFYLVTRFNYQRCVCPTAVPCTC